MGNIMHNMGIWYKELQVIVSDFSYRQTLNIVQKLIERLLDIVIYHQDEPTSLSQYRIQPSLFTVRRCVG